MTPIVRGSVGICHRGVQIRLSDREGKFCMTRRNRL